MRRAAVLLAALLLTACDGSVTPPPVETRVDVDTTVYSVKNRELLWAGRTESMDPHDVRGTVGEIADAVAAEMRKQGLIPSD